MTYTVLLESFGAIMRLGLRSVLTEADCQVLDQDGIDVDAVLFDMDQPACAAAARRLRARHPSARVIACSTRAPVMRVFEPGRTETDRPLTATALCAAVAATCPRMSST